ncbi:MAG TPA: ABC transporter ATP-binding protein [Chloroflexi bacterium]|nr:ABC transporter ATP-binding protein [Chloroflexota bacterium]
MSRTNSQETNSLPGDCGVSSFVCLDRLTKSYTEGGRTRTVLRELSLGFHGGKFSALLGKSGSGKSTLLNLISGIDVPTSGDVFIGGVPLTRLSERERTLFRRNRIGFVFQFFNLIPTLTVLENVTLPLELGGRTRGNRQAALDLLDQVGLADRSNVFPDKLSGGEQQRVAIARALIGGAMLILADEPTGNLDDEVGGRVLELLLELVYEVGKTLLVATHSREVARQADHVYRIVDGHLVEERCGRGVEVVSA